MHHLFLRASRRDRRCFHRGYRQTSHSVAVRGYERAVRHHLREHLPALLALARDAERTARADTLLDRLEALQSRTEAILEEVDGTDLYFARLGAIREMRRNLELIGEVTKELDRTPILNVHLSPEWLQLRSLIVGALAPHPEAKAAVLAAVSEVGNGVAGR